MTPIDVEAFDDYLKSVVRLDKKNDKNRKSVVRVIKKLVSGKGVTHKNRPGETFLAGHVLQLSDDLEAIQTQAAEWLPYRKNDPNCKDKGHGWALNHPLMWLINFKKHLSGEAPPAPRKRSRKETVAAEVEHQEAVQMVVQQGNEVGAVEAHATYPLSAVQMATPLSPVQAHMLVQQGTAVATAVFI